MTDRWQRLESLVAVMVDGDLAALNAIKAEQAAIESKRAGLLASRRSVEGDGAEHVVTGYATSRADVYCQWIDRELTQLNTRLAQLRAENEIMHQRAVKNLGRKQVIERLMSSSRG